MRIVLINPPFDLKYYKGLKKPVFHSLFYNSPPLGLGYLASSLLQAHYEVSIIDALVEKMNFAEVVTKLQSLSPDVVGITATSVGFLGAVMLARAIKKWQPEVPVLLGGAHISANPETAMEEPAFDFGFRGEGERSLLEFLEVYATTRAFGSVRGMVWRDNGTLVINPPQSLIENLDSLPPPALHLFSIKKYRPLAIDARSFPKLQIITSRGCPYKCIFCEKSVFGNRYRVFSPQRVGDELEHVVREYHVRDIAFLDSLFNINATRVEAILAEIEKRNLHFTWSCSVRVDNLTYDLLQHMKQRGCWRIRIGIESGNETVLKFINKQVTLAQIGRVTRWADKLGIQVKAFFMIGHLIDTPERIEDSIRFAKSIPLKDITVQINTTLPNTTQFKLYERYGTIIRDQTNPFSFWEPMFVPHGMTQEQLQKYLTKFYRSFYLRPSLIWRHLKAIRSFHDVWVYIRSLSLPFTLFFDTEKLRRIFREKNT